MAQMQQQMGAQQYGGQYGAGLALTAGGGVGMAAPPPSLYHPGSYGGAGGYAPAPSEAPSADGAKQEKKVVKNPKVAPQNAAGRDVGKHMVSKQRQRSLQGEGE